MKNLLLFFVSVLIAAGCSSHNDQSLMDSAKKNHEQNKFKEAVADYETLVKEYPNSPLAPEALFQVASIYQYNKLGSANETESLEKAVATYKSVNEKYAESKQAEKSLFTAGFIEANSLKKYEQATATYKLFINKYPKSELVPAAKQELEIMGIPPEQLIEKKQVSNK